MPLPAKFIKDTVSFRLGTFTKRSHVPVHSFKFESKKRKKRINKYFGSVLAVAKDRKLYVPNNTYVYLGLTPYSELEFLSDDYATFISYDDGLSSGTPYVGTKILLLKDFDRKYLRRKTILEMCKEDPELRAELENIPRRELDLLDALKKFIKRKEIREFKGE